MFPRAGDWRPCGTEKGPGLPSVRLQGSPIPSDLRVRRLPGGSRAQLSQGRRSAYAGAMQTLIDLYLQNPFWIWMAVGAVFVALEIAVGAGWLIWPAAAGAVVALIALVGARLGVGVELAIFFVLSAAGVALSFGLGKRKPRAPSKAQTASKPAPPGGASAETGADRAARLIGRIGRTTG